jgi:energy-coupling factor transporter ATP-binding protein EcfA2
MTPSQPIDKIIARHAADHHDLIRVQGARENNLKDVSVEIPKRRLTVFTGVSGSGKSSLVFGTIAAESQRLINETYSAFLQNFMPSLGRPEERPLDGRHGHRRQRDVAPAVEPPRQAAHRPVHGVFVQRPDAQGERRDGRRQGQR